VNQNYFAVHDSNAAALGGITDRELRRSIVSVYKSANSLVAFLNHNNEQFHIWDRLRIGIVHEPTQSQQILSEYKIIPAAYSNDLLVPFVELAVRKWEILFGHRSEITGDVDAVVLKEQLK
jgi:hypothetical protein